MFDGIMRVILNIDNICDRFSFALAKALTKETQKDISEFCAKKIV